MAQPFIPPIIPHHIYPQIDKAREREKIECIVEQLTTPRPPIPVPSIATRSDIKPYHLHLQYEDDLRDGREFDEVSIFV